MLGVRDRRRFFAACFALHDSQNLLHTRASRPPSLPLAQTALPQSQDRPGKLPLLPRKLERATGVVKKKPSTGKETEKALECRDMARLKAHRVSPAVALSRSVKLVLVSLEVLASNVHELDIL